jgi:hypothetical protein
MLWAMRIGSTTRLVKTPMAALAFAAMVCASGLVLADGTFFGTSAA